MTWGELKQHLNQQIPDDLEIGWMRIDADTRNAEDLVVSSLIDSLEYPLEDGRPGMPAIRSSIRLSIPHVNIADSRKLWA